MGRCVVHRVWIQGNDAGDGVVMDSGEFLMKTIERNLAGCSEFFWDSFVALRTNGITGGVEFGSWGANTLRAVYEHLRASGVPRHMWAFDSFEGLPEPVHAYDEHPVWSNSRGQGQAGVDKFHAACAKHGIPRDAYTAVAGYYEDSLPPLGPDMAPSDIALVYVDCNMYSSTVAVLEFLAPW